MRVAFDLDSTLIRDSNVFPLEKKTIIQKLFFVTGIRENTKQLFNKLRNENNEIWIYTASYRIPILIRLLFCTYGLKIDGIVNQRKHDRYIDKNEISCIKYPPKFEIDILIDNSEKIYQEGITNKFRVIKILPEDIDWNKTILEELSKK